MIRLFSRLRRTVAADSKYRKYLFYALGEIALVVIGILIALAINNQNQKRLNAKTEQTYLKGLKQEFLTSQAKLAELMAVNQRNYDGARQILQYISHADSVPDEAAFSSLLFNTFSMDVAFNPNNSLLIEIISSGNLKNITNPKLRLELTNWISTLEDVARQEDDLEIQRAQIINMFNSDDYSMRTVLVQSGVQDALQLPEAKPEMSNLSLLSSPAFENNVLVFILTNHGTKNAHYVPLQADINAILALIEQEIKN